MNHVASPASLPAARGRSRGDSRRAVLLLVVLAVSVPVCAAPPAITAEPQSASTVDGQNASFTGAASGDPTPVLLWQRKPAGSDTWQTLSQGGVFSGVATPTLVLTGVTYAMNGDQFRFVAANGEAPDAVSAAATLTVTPVAPTITQHPANAVTAAGTPAQFSVTASGTLPLTYQWHGPDGQPLAGATAATLTLANPQSAQAGVYRVFVSNVAGSVPSNFASLTVTPSAPTVTTPPAGQSAYETQSVTFTVVARGTEPFTYQWQRNNAALDGATSASLTVENLTVANAGDYRVIVTNGVNSTASAAATLTVLAAAPAITTSPLFQSVAPGATATFTAAASGMPPLNFQWRRNGQPLPGATAATLDVVAAVAEDIAAYDVVVTNAAGSATSAAAALEIFAPYAIATQAGSAGLGGSTNATGADARFNFPERVAFDAAGNAYVADTNNHLIRKVTPAGVVTTLAGTAHVPGSNDGTGTAARFNFPRGLAVDLAGNVYVADTSNHTIRRITPAGLVTTLAGSAGATGSTNGTGSAARFNFPHAIASDAVSGDLFVADTSNHTIRRVTTAGGVTTFAGTAGSSGTTDGTGAAARFNLPRSLGVDPSGNLFVADTNNHTLRKITPAGVVTTFAGQPGVQGNAYGTGSAATFRSPHGLAVDGAGYIYVADTGNSSLRYVTPAGEVRHLAGTNGVGGSADGTFTAARFSGPMGLAIDATGNLAVADTGNHTIRRGVGGRYFAPAFLAPPAAVVTAAGQNATFTVRVAGVPGTLTYQWQRKPAGSAEWSDLANGAPYSGVTTATLAVAVATAHDGDEFRCRVANDFFPAGTSAAAQLDVDYVYTFTTLSGTAGTAGSTNSDLAGSTYISPMMLAYHRRDYPDAYLYALEQFSGTGRVRLVRPSQGSVTTYNQNSQLLAIAADNAGDYYYSLGSNRSVQRFNLSNQFVAAYNFGGSPNLSGLAVDPAGNVFVAYPDLSLVLKRTPAGTLSTFVSGGLAPRYLAADRDGNVYVSDQTNHRVLKYSPAGTLLLAVGAAGSAGHVNGDAATTRFSSPAGLAVDALGRIYVADAGNHVIRMIQLDGTTTTIAGSPGQPGSANGSGPAARFNSPSGIAIGPDAVLYVADTGNHVIRRGVSPTIPTQIIAPPASVTINQGGNFRLDVEFFGSGPYTFTWYRGATFVRGGSSSPVYIFNAQPGHAGDYRVDVTNAAGTVTSAAATVTVHTPSDQWRVTHFGGAANSGPAADAADPDGDGLVNLLEYALGTNPQAATPSPYGLSVDGDGRLVLSVTKNPAATDLQYAAQVSGDLVTWSSGDVTVLTNDSTTFTARDNAAIGSRRFLRLVVTRP